MAIPPILVGAGGQYSGLLQRGTRALQPAASAVEIGTLYFVTDETITERSNGSAWQTFTDAGAGGVSDGDKGDITVSSSGAAWTIDNGVVTNAKSADMAQSTIKGRAVSAGTGAPTDLTATQATAILDVMVGDTGTGGTKGLVPAPASGDAAAGKFLKADGTYSAPSGSGAPSSSQYVTLATDGGLSAERVLTAGTGITLTDAGANSTVTVALTTPTRYVVASSDESVSNNTTPQDDDELLFSAAINSVYVVEVCATFTSGTDASIDASITWSVPASATITWSVASFQTTATSIDGQTRHYTRYQSTSLVNNGVLSTATIDATPIWITAVVRTAGTSGNVTFKWAQASTSGTALVRKTDSFLRYTKTS